MTVESRSAFDEVLRRFEALEKEFELSKWKINGVHVWKLLRHQMFGALRQAWGLAAPAHPEMERLRKSKLAQAVECHKLLSRRNPFLAASQSASRIVIPHSRKAWYHQTYADPISLRAWLGSLGTDSAVLDKTSPLDPHPLVGSFDYDVLRYMAWIKRQFVRVKLTPSDNDRIEQLTEALTVLPGNAWRSPHDQVKRVVSSFLAMKSVFGALLRRFRPHTLYVVVGYAHAAAIAAAQQHDVITAEFQHGAVGRGHLGYDFRGWGEVPYFPDRLLAFGSAWFNDVALPSHTELVPVGAPHIEDFAAAARRRVPRKEKQLLVLSQGPYAKQILGHAVQFARARPDWSVVVRPHPSESVRSMQGCLRELIPGETPHVSVENERPLHVQGAESRVALGVSSTAMVEALLAGCKLAVLALPNAAMYFRSLVDEAHATKVEDGNELAACIENIPEGSARGYFSAPISNIVAHVEAAPKSFTSRLHRQT